MIARLEFDLPDERFEFECAANAEKWRAIVWELDQSLRDLIKYSDHKNSLDIPTMIDVREMIRDKMNGENLSFD
jgi:hypothetical protein